MRKKFISHELRGKYKNNLGILKGDIELLENYYGELNSLSANIIRDTGLQKFGYGDPVGRLFILREKIEHALKILNDELNFIQHREQSIRADELEERENEK